MKSSYKTRPLERSGLNLIIIGPSGSGKGTQAQLLAEQFNLIHLSTGELFRYEYEKKTPEGLAAHVFWIKGKWVPDKETFALLKKNLPQDYGFILDGFPRTVSQAQMLDEYLKEKRQALDAVIYLKVSDKEAIKRLILRGQKDAELGMARKDETEELIKERLVSFKETFAPIVTYYKKQGKLLEVDGEKSVEEIHKDILGKLP